MTETLAQHILSSCSTSSPSHSKDLTPQSLSGVIHHCSGYEAWLGMGMADLLQVVVEMVRATRPREVLQALRSSVMKIKTEKQSKVERILVDMIVGERIVVSTGCFHGVQSKMRLDAQDQRHEATPIQDVNSAAHS